MSALKMALSAEATEFRPGAGEHVLRGEQAVWHRSFSARALLASLLSVVWRRPG